MKDKLAMTDFYLYLNELRALNLERLVQVNTIEEVKRLQGSIMTIDSIVHFTRRDEEEIEIQNKYLGEMQKWTQ